ncbi:hypothetical protein RRG08_042730 [Elysia crispata]|uniref:Uncharacterized protein n=1 Tax=Elysia crispata TaxID=231223 RepID=A0AAE0XQQ3_9GAST|nr:hypothetical protein RRG08_042730 [Elysia crispata]
MYGCLYRSHNMYDTRSSEVRANITKRHSNQVSPEMSLACRGCGMNVKDSDSDAKCSLSDREDLSDWPSSPTLPWLRQTKVLIDQPVSVCQIHHK